MPVIPFARKRPEDERDLPVVEIETPVPLPARPATTLEDASKPSPKRISLKSKLALLGAMLALPPVLYFGAMFDAHKIGDDLAFPEDVRTTWTVPWAGVSAALLEREYAEYGWSPEAAAWTPTARLSAMPAFQSALAGALADHTALAAEQAGAGEDAADPDLQAAARLLSGAPNNDQLRAAREAFISFDGRARRRTVSNLIMPSDLAERLDLTAGWARASSEELIQISDAARGAPFDKTAIQAVYRAKARAYAAHRLMSAMDHPYESDAHDARAAALASLERAASFTPLIVVNGAADGWPGVSHTAALSGLMADVERRLGDYASGVRRLDRVSPPPAGDLAANLH